VAKKLPVTDPAEALNQRVLKQRQQRIIAKEVEESIDLGLKIPEKKFDSAAELLRDQFDKQSFGDAPKTTTRVVYGPDPIVTNCPEFHERLERYGLEAVADAFMELILKKKELAAPDPIMRKGLRASIAKFGVDATAKAFRDRILRIPQRTVEIELDDVIDPLIINPMRNVVAKYGPLHPGMSFKFLSDRCNDVLGLRGYEVVKDERGDPVKIGTLIMGMIPEYIAQRRMEHFAEEGRAQVRDMEEAYYDKAQREIAGEGGAMRSGASLLRPGERVTASMAVNDEYDGASRETGLRFAGE
jgi:hypothetical protein